MRAVIGSFATWANLTLYSLLVLVLHGLIVLLAGGLFNRFVLSPHAGTGLRDAALRHGFEPTIDGLALHISQAVEPGMSRQDVQQVLETVGTVRRRWESQPEANVPPGGIDCDRLVFEVRSTSSVPFLGRVADVSMSLLACYNSAGQLYDLTYESGIMESDYPHLDIYEPASSSQ